VITPICFPLAASRCHIARGIAFRFNADSHPATPNQIKRWSEINVHHRYATGEYIPDKPIVNPVFPKLCRLQTMSAFWNK
jgi:hypothetical protein